MNIFLHENSQTLNIFLAYSMLVLPSTFQCIYTILSLSTCSCLFRAILVSDIKGDITYETPKVMLLVIPHFLDYESKVIA